MKTNDRICEACGATMPTSIVLKMQYKDKTMYKCTKCILFESEESINQDILSGTYAFTDGETSFEDYNKLLDDAEMLLEDLEEI